MTPAEEKKIAACVRAKQWRIDNPERYAATKRAYAEKNRERIAAYKAEWAKANDERLREKRQAYYEAHKDVIVARSLRWAESNRDRYEANQIAYRKENAEKKREYTRSWVKQNPERKRAADKALWERNGHIYRERHKQWLRANRGLKNASEGERRAAKLQATPKWANKFFMQEAYRLASLRTKVTGITWHVDHIVPLKSKFVCGLHVEHNLQVIPGVENIRKKNRYWPDMP